MATVYLHHQHSSNNNKRRRSRLLIGAICLLLLVLFPSSCAFSLSSSLGKTNTYSFTIWWGVNLLLVVNGFQQQLVIDLQSSRCYHHHHRGGGGRQHLVVDRQPAFSRFLSRHSCNWSRLCSQDHRQDDEEENEDISCTTTVGRAGTKAVGLPLTRRQALIQTGIAAASVTSTAFLPPLLILPANAAKPELDSSGVLFSPRPEMLSGGSVATRGIPVSGSRKFGLQPGQNIQSIYETRFVAYLSRFLLNYDNAARAWWMKQGLSDSWENTADIDPILIENTFAEFAESVEIGLADYFSGPFGSYSSVLAAAAGISAAQQAKSIRPDPSTTAAIPIPTTTGFFDNLTGRSDRQIKKQTYNINLARQGILNLYALLKARYNTLAAKRQLAILFSFITSPYLQPTSEICSLLGEADNTTITQIELIRPRINSNEANSRNSPQRGGGYSVETFPAVTVDSPPPLGDKYKQGEAKPIMRSTSRILKITLVDGGEGYTRAPTVSVRQFGATRQCHATAILDREGHIESIVVLDPGYGYGGTKGEIPPRVAIEPPEIIDQNNPMQRRITRRARAVAWMEYEVAKIEVIGGGNGYISTEPPMVSLSPPPIDPDWFLNIQEQPELRMIPVTNNDLSLRAQVSEMKFADGNVAFSVSGIPARRTTKLDDTMLERLQRDPLELLPSSIRPEKCLDPKSKNEIYLIEPLVGIPQFVAVMSPLYRACDPVFGGVGRVPVTKGANQLQVGEYARLALSGAVCTVIVRTLLNPLELIKTKQQLGNDEELYRYAQERRAGLIPPIANDEKLMEPSRSSATFLKVQVNLVSSQTRTREISVPDQQPTPPVPAMVLAAPTANLQTEDAVLMEAPKTIVGMRESIDIGLHTEPTKVNTFICIEEPANVVDTVPPKLKIGTLELIQSLVELRGPAALFQSADITFLASLVFGSFGFGATELFRRSFDQVFAPPGNDGTTPSSTTALLLAAALATMVTSAMATPFEVLRVRSMGMVEAVKWSDVLQDYLNVSKGLKSLRPSDLGPLWSGFAPTLSRELPFAITKFLAFDTLARLFVDLLNRQAGAGALPIQVGLGPAGLTVSAAAGALAGIAGAVVSHPADLILTKTSASRRQPASSLLAQDEEKGTSMQQVFQELIQKEGGLSNLFVGLGARATFFFLVIGLQFFLYDYVKSLFQVGSDDLSLVLDVFYAVRAGLVEAMQQDSAQ